MNTDIDLDEKIQRDRVAWDHCSRNYERRIVEGHPDVHAYEAFEETLIDSLLLYMARQTASPLSVIDLGCGSGRLLVRLAAQITDPGQLDEESTLALQDVREYRPDWAWIPELQDRLKSISGIDFSRPMLELARTKFDSLGLRQHLTLGHVQLLCGSVFSAHCQAADTIPVIVCLLNSIGVMQGIAGARKLFQAIHRTVTAAGGIGLVSCFCRENVRSHALGQYESTMDVSGPPVWLCSDRYDLSEKLYVPTSYRRYNHESDWIEVDVYKTNGELVEKGHRLQRIPHRIEEVSLSGVIRTYQGYESRWYSKSQIGELIAKFWGDAGWQLSGMQVDPLRAKAVQLAFCDPAGHGRRWLEQLTGEYIIG